MRKCFLIALLSVCLVAARPINGHGQNVAPTVQVFFGGSKLWEHVTGGPYHNSGWKLAVTGSFNRFLGLEMDVSKFRAENELPGAPAYGDRFRLLFGPYFAYNANSRLNPFAHALVGVTNGRQCPPTSSCFLTSEEVRGNAFTAAVGGGLDVKVYRFFWLRPIQADYLHVSFPNAAENNLQLSFGFTLRLGSRGKNRKD